LDEWNLADGTGNLFIRDFNSLALALEARVALLDPDPRVRKAMEGPRVVLDLLQGDSLDWVFSQKPSQQVV
jgi:hypothetical protein